MNSATIKGKWNEVKGLLVEKYGQLSGDELSKAQGDVQRLIGIVQQKTGRSLEEIESYVSSALDKASSVVSRLAETGSEYASDAVEYVRQGYDQASDMAQQGYESTRQVVQRSPVESVAVAFGVGVLAGIVGTLCLQSPRR